MEWLHSPIIYQADEAFLSRMRGLESTYFNAIKVMYHYASMYIKHDKRYLQNAAYPLKRFLYYLRGILACRWIEERQSMPPVLFSDLVNATVREEGVCHKIEALLALKRQSKENDLKEVDADVVEYARYWAEHFEQAISSFRPEISYNGNSAQLDGLLREKVMGW